MKFMGFRSTLRFQIYFQVLRVFLLRIKVIVILIRVLIRVLIRAVRFLIEIRVIRVIKWVNLNYYLL